MASRAKPHLTTSLAWPGLGRSLGSEPIRQELARAIGFDVPHSHNGYLDVQVQVGAVGLGLILLVLLLVGIRGLAYYLRSDSPLSSWALILTLVLILYNRVETSFSAPSTIFLMFATLVVLQRTQSDKAIDTVAG